MTEAPEQQHNGDGMEERGCRRDSRFKVFSEAAIAIEPGEGTLDDPASGLYGEADLPPWLAHDLDGDRCGRPTLRAV